VSNQGVVLTPEFVARVQKLESIFSPEAFRQREAKRKKENPGVEGFEGVKANYAHYTTADAALKIITTKRLWMRSTTCMSDYREVNHGYDLLLKYFQDQPKKAAFFAAMDAVHPNAVKAAVELFDKWWGQIRVKTHIASVSEHDAEKEDYFGRLSMWRAVGSDAPRVAIVFSVPWYSPATIALGLMFSPVAYLGEDGAYRILDEVVANVTRERTFLKSITPQEFQGWIFQMLLAGVCCAKHEGFWEEREWRGVYSPALGLPTVLERSTEIIRGVPQPILSVPFDGEKYPVLADLDMAKILRRIIIGPTSYAWVMYEAFVEALKKIGVPKAEEIVWSSNLPIRSA
jgi:hypothetical protein